MIDFTAYTTDLVSRDGIFFSKQANSVSYPESGNDICFQIEENSFWFKHRNNCIVESVKKYCPNATFFDIGGGNGFVAKGLEAQGIPTVLIEPGITGCVNAQARGLQHIVCSTLENAAFKADSIAAIGLFDVVEHIEHDVTFLQNIHSFLQKQGLVFITVPAFNALWSNEDDDAGHFRRYSIAQMSEKLESVGFTIEYATYIFSILPIPVFLFRSLPSKLGLNANSNDAEKHKKEHEAKTGFLDTVLNKIWAYELKTIKNGGTIPVGGSCFIVARKK